MVDNQDDPNSPSLTTRMGAACVGGFFAAFLSLPFDLLKSRLQDVRVDPKTGKLPFTGLTDCAMQVVAGASRAHGTRERRRGGGAPPQ